MEEQATVALSASVEFVGRWRRLVSTTNWEKGRIISEWRQALREADAAAASYTDESWSRQVGNVTPQHVGRLRRVHERFGGDFEQYPGLYWSHFHAASIGPTRRCIWKARCRAAGPCPTCARQRWEAVGAPADTAPADVGGALRDGRRAGRWRRGILPPTISESFDEVHAAGSAEETAGPSGSNHDDAETAKAAVTATDPLVRPFEALPEMPPDVAEAMELFKLAILAHKVAGSRDIARKDLLAVLDSLRQLALAPAE